MDGRQKSAGTIERGTVASSKLIKFTLCSLLLLLLLASTLDQVEGQFFTKSSKSIPRMGRRSLPEYQNAMEAYKQMLADDYNEQQAAFKGEELLGGEPAEMGRGRLANLIRSRPRASDFDYTSKMSRDVRASEYLD